MQNDLSSCAEASLYAAIASERAGNLEAAFSQYQEALEFWLNMLRVETDQDKIDTLRGLLETYMAHAETIKATINQRKNAPPPPAPRAMSPQPPPASSTTTPSAAAASQGRKKSDLTDYTTGIQPVKGQKKAPPAAATRPAAGGGAPAAGAAAAGGGAAGAGGKSQYADPEVHNEYENQIRAEMLDSSPGVKWDDISGLAFAKQTLQEAVILPNLRPDLFTGLRSPAKGVLLYGPPGTGKTMLAKAVATESGFSFFSISAASVTSKYLGEGEKLMRALFSLARSHQPSVIFFDEIDALLSARKESEHEASRRLKTEFMVQMDGAASCAEDRVLIIGATNMPWEIDEAVLRRLAKRIYVPLPDAEAREALIRHLMVKHQGKDAARIVGDRGSMSRIVHMTQGYSGSDLTAVCKEAAMGPIRQFTGSSLKTVKLDDVRPIQEQDFLTAVSVIRPSVSPESLAQFDKWSESFGVVR